MEYFITWLKKYQEVLYVAFYKQHGSPECNHRNINSNLNLLQHLYYVSHGNDLMVITRSNYFIDYTSFSCQIIVFTGHHTFSIIDVMPMARQFRTSLIYLIHCFQPIRYDGFI